MLRYVMAALLAAAPIGPLQSQQGNMAQQQKTEGWALAAMPNGCMVQAVSPRGTMISIWAFAGEKELGFLLQNPRWEVEDGKKTPLQVEFSGTRAWPVEATGRANIDSDGPGLYFTVEPGAAADRGNFLAAFTSARGMSIRREGASVDTLPLAGSRGAISSLAKCLADRWNEAGPAPAEAEEAPPPDETI
jgi:hypothetical protein